MILTSGTLCFQETGYRLRFASTQSLFCDVDAKFDAHHLWDPRLEGAGRCLMPTIPVVKSTPPSWSVAGSHARAARRRQPLLNVQHHPAASSSTLLPVLENISVSSDTCFQVLQQLAAAARVRTAVEQKQACNRAKIQLLDDLYEELEEVFCESPCDHA